MASVKVAVRLRPLNQREIGMKSKVIIDMKGKLTTIENLKVPEHSVGDKTRERIKNFSYDFSYWSVDKKSAKYASQEQVFQDLGMDVVNNACEGYNTCVFAYGQTGSGKTYTMMGNPGDEGLIPRSCQELFKRMKDESMTYRTEVSYLEIYNEKVRDLLKQSSGKVQHNLRVREHPKNGPYVQDLSKHIVGNYKDIRELMDKGNQSRTTASTNMNDVSSRSHAIFTIIYTQAKFSKECPIETHSKIHLVDLAGSERADATGATGQRLKEGGSINKSLVTLGNVISTLAELSGKSSRRSVFIPYRDSTLTWLLKDSLGGNAKTMMIATISPADCNYPETLSTLRYANRAKDIINKPTVNEDQNVKLIRELKAEIERLKTLLGGHIDSITTPKVKEKLHENEARIKVLTQEWTGKWHEVANILGEEKSLALRKEGMGVVLDSDLPHLIGIDDDLLSTGIMLYHLKEGTTNVGSHRDKSVEQKPDIILSGPDVETEHCSFVHQNGEVTLIPGTEAPCSVNGNTITEPIKLSQGAVILLGQTNMFRFNHPAQVAKLKEGYKGLGQGLSRISLSQSMTDLCRSTETLGLATSGWEFENKHFVLLEQLEDKRLALEDLEEKYHQAEATRLAEQEKKEQELETARNKLQELQTHLQNSTGQFSNLTEEKSKLKDLIEHEMGILLKKETDNIKEAQQQKESMAKELQDLQQVYERDKAQLELQLSELKQKKNSVENSQNQIQQEIDTSKQLVEDSQMKLEQHRSELSSLEKLKLNPGDFSTLAPKLSESVQLTLLEENKKLCNAQESLRQKEKEIYHQYKNKLDDIKEQKVTTLKDIAREREQIEADRVYLQECEDRLPETLAGGDTVAYQREKKAIEDENKRIKEEEEKLNVIESEIDRVVGEDLTKVEEEHAKDIDDVNKERDRLKLYTQNWKGLVNTQLDECSKRFDTVRKDVSSHTEKLEHLLLKHSVKQKQLKQDEDLFSTQITDLGAEMEDKGKILQVAIDKVEEENSSKQELINTVLLELDEKRKILSNVNIDDIKNDIELRQAWVKIQCACSDSSETEMQQLEDKIQELLEVERRIAIAQKELEERCSQYEEERQEENDSIEQERFALQELEEEERVNSLVEQEIKRRLFEERVEREKQRHIEREREKAERESELNRIKRAHHQELTRLKEKIENSGALVENTPTRANPYASVMSGDVTPTSNSSGLRKTKSVSRTNLARAQSNPSIGLPVKPIEVMIPGFVQRGSGFDSHIEFEIQITVLEDTWSVFRRYSKFRELHSDLKSKFPEVGALLFPPKRWFGNKSEKVAGERRILLENYLSHIVDILQTEPSYPLHPSHSRIYSKQVLTEFHSFFKKGIFETNSRHGTG